MNIPTANMQTLRIKAGLAAGDTTKDAVIQATADMTLSLMERYCDRKFEFANETETFTHVTGNTISLIRYPLVAIASVSGGTGSQLSKYHFDGPTGLIFFDGYIARHQITIQYAGGYKTLPEELWAAFYDIYSNIFGATDDPTQKYGTASAGGIKALSAGDLRITYDTGGGGLTGSSGGAFGGMLSPFAATVLDLFKREKA